jgi:hypothetical protein
MGSADSSLGRKRCRSLLAALVARHQPVLHKAAGGGGRGWGCRQLTDGPGEPVRREYENFYNTHRPTLRKAPPLRQLADGIADPDQFSGVTALGA